LSADASAAEASAAAAEAVSVPLLAAAATFAADDAPLSAACVRAAPIEVGSEEAMLAVMRMEVLFILFCFVQWKKKSEFFFLPRKKKSNCLDLFSTERKEETQRFLTRSRS
jgi:hypothetical protein